MAINIVGATFKDRNTVEPSLTGAGYRNTPGFAGSPNYAGSLASGSGLTVADNGTYRNYSFGTKLITNSNVTFQGFQAKIGNQDILWGLQTAGTGPKLDYGTFVPNDSGPPTSFANSYQFGFAMGDWGSTAMAKGTQITNCDFRGFGNCITCFGDNGATQSDWLLIQDTWIHDACPDNTYHTDGIGTLNNGETAKGIWIDHCIIGFTGNTNLLAFQNGTFSNIKVTNSVFYGAGYGICFGVSNGMATNITFTDNEWWTLLKPAFGPMYPNLDWVTATGSTWARNKWRTQADSNMLARFPWLSGLTWAWGTSGNDGKYWIPDGSDVGGGDYSGSYSEASFISNTDV